MLPRIDRRRTAVVVVAAVVASCVQVGVGVVTGTLIGRVTATRAVNGRTLALVLALPALLLLLQYATLCGESVGQSLKRRVDGDLRRRVLDMSLTPAGIAHLEDPELRALHSTARNLSPFSFTPGDAAVALTPALAVRLQPLVAVAVLAWYEPVAAVLALLLWAVAQLLFVVITIRLVMGAASSMASPDLVYIRDLLHEPAAAKEVRVFGLAPWLMGRYRERTTGRIAASLAVRRGHSRSYARGGLVLGLGLGGGFAWVGWQHAGGALSTGAAAVCVFALLSIFFVPALLPDVPIMFGVFAVDAVEAAEKASRAERPGLATGGTISGAGTNGDRAPETGPLHLHLRGVTFGYADGPPVLRGLELEIPPGQRLAVVGLNGAGKTTLVKLLCRLYDPDDGTIEAGGVPLRDLDPQLWRRRTGVLFQDYIRYHLPAYDNVCLRPLPSPGAVSGTAAEAVWAAARGAGVDDLVAQLPSGWETPLHPAARGGVDLSGGQWQRLALARALHAVEQGADLLILDEPTANLDPRAELDFYDSVLARELGNGRLVTTILISHRFATVRHADRIVVLDGGAVTQDGTHDELMRVAGAYRTLFESQAKAFAEVGHV